eukprot:5162097-Amphidinium_carterae.1
MIAIKCGVHWSGAAIGGFSRIASAPHAPSGRRLPTNPLAVNGRSDVLVNNSGPRFLIYFVHGALSFWLLHFTYSGR